MEESTHNSRMQRAYALLKRAELLRNTTEGSATVVGVAGGVSRATTIRSGGEGAGELLWVEDNGNGPTEQHNNAAPTLTRSSQGLASSPVTYEAIIDEEERDERPSHALATRSGTPHLQIDDETPLQTPRSPATLTATRGALVVKQPDDAVVLSSIDRAPRQPMSTPAEPMQTPAAAAAPPRRQLPNPKGPSPTAELSYRVAQPSPAPTLAAGENGLLGPLWPTTPNPAASNSSNRASVPAPTIPVQGAAAANNTQATTMPVVNEATTDADPPQSQYQLQGGNKVVGTAPPVAARSVPQSLPVAMAPLPLPVVPMPSGAITTPLTSRHSPSNPDLADEGKHPEHHTPVTMVTTASPQHYVAPDVGNADRLPPPPLTPKANDDPRRVVVHTFPYNPESAVIAPVAGPIRHETGAQATRHPHASVSALTDPAGEQPSHSELPSGVVSHSDRIAARMAMEVVRMRQQTSSEPHSVIGRHVASPLRSAWQQHQPNPERREAPQPTAPTGLQLSSHPTINASLPSSWAPQRRRDSNPATPLPITATDDATSRMLSSPLWTGGYAGTNRIPPASNAKSVGRVVAGTSWSLADTTIPQPNLTPPAPTPRRRTEEETHRGSRESARKQTPPPARTVSPSSAYLPTESWMNRHRATMQVKQSSSSSSPGARRLQRDALTSPSPRGYPARGSSPLDSLAPVPVRVASAQASVAKFREGQQAQASRGVTKGPSPSGAKASRVNSAPSISNDGGRGGGPLASKVTASATKNKDGAAFEYTRSRLMAHQQWHRDALVSAATRRAIGIPAEDASVATHKHVDALQPPRGDSSAGQRIRHRHAPAAATAVGRPAARSGNSHSVHHIVDVNVSPVSPTPTKRQKPQSTVWGSADVSLTQNTLLDQSSWTAIGSTVAANTTLPSHDVSLGSLGGTLGPRPMNARMEAATSLLPLTKYVQLMTQGPGPFVMAELGGFQFSGTPDGTDVTEVMVSQWAAVTVLMNQPFFLEEAVVPLLLAELRDRMDRGRGNRDDISHLVCALIGLGEHAKSALDVFCDMLDADVGDAALLTLAIRVCGGVDGLVRLTQMTAVADNPCLQLRALRGLAQHATPSSILGHTSILCLGLGRIKGKKMFYQPHHRIGGLPPPSQRQHHDSTAVATEYNSLLTDALLLPLQLSDADHEAICNVVSVAGSTASASRPQYAKGSSVPSRSGGPGLETLHHRQMLSVVLASMAASPTPSTSNNDSAPTNVTALATDDVGGYRPTHVFLDARTARRAVLQLLDSEAYRVRYAEPSRLSQYDVLQDFFDFAPFACSRLQCDPIVSAHLVRQAAELHAFMQDSEGTSLRGRTADGVDGGSAVGLPNALVTLWQQDPMAVRHMTIALMRVLKDSQTKPFVAEEALKCMAVLPASITEVLADPLIEYASALIDTFGGDTLTRGTGGNSASHRSDGARSGVEGIVSIAVVAVAAIVNAEMHSQRLIDTATALPVHLLSHRSSDVRRAACLALGIMGPINSNPQAVIRLVLDQVRDGFVPASAGCWTLARSGRQGVACLMDVAHQAHLAPSLRIAALKAVGIPHALIRHEASSTAQAAKRVLADLPTTIAAVTNGLIRVINEHSASSSAEVLATTALQSLVNVVRMGAWASSSVRDRGSAAAEAAVVPILTDLADSSSVTCGAARPAVTLLLFSLLCEFGGLEGLRATANIAIDAHVPQMVRCACIRAMLRCGGDGGACYEPLSQFLGDDDIAIRREAMDTLAAIGVPSILQAMRQSGAVERHRIAERLTAALHREPRGRGSKLLDEWLSAVTAQSHLNISDQGSKGSEMFVL